MSVQNKHIMNCFLDERMITDEKKGGTRDWLCPSNYMAEKVYWKEIVPNQFYQRFSDHETTTLLLQPKLHQLGDFIRSSENPFKISLTLEAKVTCKPKVSHQPHRSFFFSSRKMNLFDPILGRLHRIIGGNSDDDITDVLKDALEENINEDFVYKSNWKCLEVVSAKIHFAEK